MPSNLDCPTVIHSDHCAGWRSAYALCWRGARRTLARHLRVDMIYFGGADKEHVG